MEAQIPLHRSEYDAEEIKSRELKEPTQQARPTMQAVRNDEKNDIVHNREADVQAVQPAAIEQTDKEVKEKTNRHTEKGCFKREGHRKRKFVRKE
ncbi:MAG: hypothetical protein ACLR6I_16995 [Waltera sp.]